MFRAPVVSQHKAEEQDVEDPSSFEEFNQGDDAFDTSSWTPAPIGVPFGSQIWPTQGLGSTLFVSHSSQRQAVSAASTDAASGGTVIVTSPGSELVFVNTYDSGVSSAYQNCIVAAERTIESFWSNSITLNIEFTTYYDSSKGADALTNFDSGTDAVSYATLKSKLPSIDTDLPSTDPDPAGGDDFILPEAYARMLGLSTSTPTIDDTVKLNTYYNWDYGQDVINGIMHEITEGGMGRVGGMGDLTTTKSTPIWSTMDLFRYTSRGVHDYTDGRDGQTTYFASETNAANLSNKGAPSLSFHNDYDSTGARDDTADTADWDQTAVFGSTATYETLTLAQSELDVMDALGWIPELPQDNFFGSADWETPTDWSNGSMPIMPEDAFVGGAGTATATINNDVFLNSIGTAAQSTLIVGNNSTLALQMGTSLSPQHTSSWGTGNSGTIDIDVGSTLQINGDATFQNSGSLVVGAILTDGGNGALTLDGQLALQGHGLLILGQQSPTFHTYSTGSIASYGLTNVDNTIEGGGSIQLGDFDNQANGYVEATDQKSYSLDIDASTFTNEGNIVAAALSTLAFGEDGATRSLANAGTVTIDQGADLAIRGNFTVSGAGEIALKGAGTEITSDGEGATTLTNQGTIDEGVYNGEVGNGQIGDQGLLSVNDLTFVNTGMVVANSSNTLTLNAGSLVIADGGGTLEAGSNGILKIDSNVYTGVPGATQTGGTVEAAPGGLVVLAASISDGIPSPTASSLGQVEIDAATFQMLAGASDTDPVEFMASTDTLEIDKAATTVGAISGFVSSDLIKLKGFDGNATESVTNDVLTVADGALKQTLTFQGSTYTTAQFGVIQVSGGFDILSFQTGFSGGGLTLDLAGGLASLATLTNTANDWDLVTGTGATVDIDNAQATVVGGGDTIAFDGSSGDAASLYDTGATFDIVSGSNVTLYLNSAKTSVSGGGDAIHFNSGAGNAASLYKSAGKWDAVGGSNGTVYLNGAQAVVTGGADTIDLSGGAGNAVTISGTAGHWDAVNGSNGTVYLTSGQVVVTGGDDVIDFVSGAGNAVTVAETAGHWDAVNGSNGTVYLTSGQAVVTGGDDVISFAGGSGNAVTVAGTSGHWDSVNGSNGTVYLTGGQAVVSGGEDVVDFLSGSGNTVTLGATGGDFDLVNAASATIYLDGAQSAVTGGGNTMQFIGGAGNAVSLYGTGGVWDSVTGSNGAVYLNSAQTGLAGSSDTIDMTGTSSMTQSGASDAFVFQAAIGVETINGFASTDSMQFAKSDFVNFSALMSHASQSGANTVIKLDASDKVTLTNTLDTSLVASQFHFV